MGRYLRVQINGNGILSLAEVQAYACLGVDPPSACTFYADNDGDGFGDPNQSLTQADCNNAPQGYVNNDQDFDDTERTAYNGAMEICDNIDNDGNGQIDEGADFDTDNMTFSKEAIPTGTYMASQTITTDQTVSVSATEDVHLVLVKRLLLNLVFLWQQRLFSWQKFLMIVALHFRKKKQKSLLHLRIQKKKMIH